MPDSNRLRLLSRRRAEGHDGGVSLRATALTLAYGTANQPAVLENLDFCLEPGRFDVLVGPNGAGKSTLLRALAGLHIPRQGQVLLEQQELQQLPLAKRARVIGFLPQEINPVFAYSVEQTVALGARVAGHGHWFDRQRSPATQSAIRQALELVDATDLQHRSLAQLSGGERRRVLIASVLAQKPQYLLLDEPAAMLDLHHQASLFRLLAKLADTGMGVACVTHDWNLGAAFANRITVLHHGRILASGPPADILQESLLQQVFGSACRLLPVTHGPGVVLPQ